MVEGVQKGLGPFDRDDALGIERVLAGIAAVSPDDAARLERGSTVFDGLYAQATKELARAGMTDVAP